MESHELNQVRCHNDSSCATVRHLVQVQAELSNSHKVRQRRISTKHSSGIELRDGPWGSSFRLRDGGRVRRRELDEEDISHEAHERPASR